MRAWLIDHRPMRQRRVESISTARLKKGRGSQVVPPLAILWNTMELYVVGAAGSECIPRALRQLPYITVLHEAAFRGTALDVCAIESVLRVLRSMRALQQPSSAKLGGFALSVNSVLAALADFHLQIFMGGACSTTGLGCAKCVRSLNLWPTL